MRSKNISALLLISSLVTGFNLKSESAIAASGFSCLASGTSVGSYLFDQGTDKNAFKNTCSTTDIGIVEGRAGVAGAGDYEVAIGLNGAQANLSDQLELDWVDEFVYNWTLNWNATTNTATFSVGGNSIDYVFTGLLDRFNAFGIQARADAPSQYISEGTTIDFNVNSVTFNPDPADLNPSIPNTSITDNSLNLFVSATSSSTASNNIEHNFYTINAGAPALNSVLSEITSMSGTFSLDIPDGGLNPQDERARSRIGFQLLLFDPPVDNATPVPEPTSIFSLLTLSFFGLQKIKKK